LLKFLEEKKKEKKRQGERWKRDEVEERECGKVNERVIP
jgi:hypothetical protein